MVRLSQEEWLHIFKIETHTAYNGNIINRQERTVLLRDALLFYRAWIALDREYTYDQSLLVLSSCIPEAIRRYPLPRLIELLRYRPRSRLRREVDHEIQLGTVHEDLFPHSVDDLLDNRGVGMNQAVGGGPGPAPAAPVAPVPGPAAPAAPGPAAPAAPGPAAPAAPAPAAPAAPVPAAPAAPAPAAPAAPVPAAPAAPAAPAPAAPAAPVPAAPAAPVPPVPVGPAPVVAPAAPVPAAPVPVAAVPLPPVIVAPAPAVNMAAANPGGIGGPNVRLKFTDLMPVDFRGDGAQIAKDWLGTFRRYVRLHALADDEALTRLRLFLTGIALSWYQNKQFNTVDEFEYAFLQQFGEYHSRAAMVDALSSKKLVPGASVVKYLTEIQDLVAALHLGPDSVLDAFLRGLPHSIQDTITVMPHDNLEHLVTTVQRLVERDVKKRSSYDVGIPQFQQALDLNMSDMTSRVKDFTLYVAKAQDELQSTLQRSQKQIEEAIVQQQNVAERKSDTMANVRENAGRGRGRGNRRGGRRFEGNCYNCGTYGHSARNCFNRNVSGGTSGYSAPQGSSTFPGAYGEYSQMPNPQFAYPPSQRQQAYNSSPFVAQGQGQMYAPPYPYAYNPYATYWPPEQQPAGNAQPLPAPGNAQTTSASIMPALSSGRNDLGQSSAPPQ